MSNNEESYRLTPKMCAYIALKEAEFVDSVTEETVQMKLFWLLFCENMKKQGYLND